MILIYDDTMMVKIPEGIWKGLDERSKEKGFNSTEDFIIHILKQVIEKLEENKTVSKKDEGMMKDELRKLGYLD